MSLISKVAGAALALALALPFGANATPFAWTVTPGSTLAVQVNLSCDGSAGCLVLLGGTASASLVDTSFLFGGSGGVLASSDISTGSLNIGQNGVFDVQTDPNGPPILAPALNIIGTNVFDAVQPIGLLGDAISSLTLTYELANLPFVGTWTEGVVDGAHAANGALIGGWSTDLYGQSATCAPGGSPATAPPSGGTVAPAGCTLGANPVVGTVADPNNPDLAGGSLEWISANMFTLTGLATQFELDTVVLEAIPGVDLIVNVVGDLNLSLKGTLPEPSTIALLGMGVFGIAAWRRRA